MKCQRCSSKRIMESMGKASDCQVHSIDAVEHCGGLQVQHVLDGDYLRFKLCLDCGQVQGSFPVPRILELELDNDDSDYDVRTAWGRVTISP